MNRGVLEPLRRLPLMQRVARRIGLLLFPGSRSYWQRRYDRGSDSGAGSGGEVALFKAEIINAFVREHEIQSVVELGCGDGRQLSLAEYPRYLGLDVAAGAVDRCRELFAGDLSKSFALFDPEHMSDPAGFFRADCALSLDVVFHLVEDETFELYMALLFEAGRRFVIVHSSNHEDRERSHVRHRRFTDWVERNRSDFRLVEHHPARHPELSFSEFFIFARNSEP